jgi:hypothetical protein
MFNHSVSRYRLTAHLVLAVLVLFGLGAGHLATRALGAPASQVPASTVFRDDLAVGLKSDGLNGGLYENGQACVVDLVDTGGNANLTTPGITRCSAQRSFQLDLGTTLCSLAPVRDLFDPLDPQRELNLCGSPNTVYGQVVIGSLFGNRKLTGMGVYFSMDPTYVAGVSRSASFLLDYGPSVQRNGGGDSATTRTVTADVAYLFQYIPSQTGHYPTRKLLGTVSVPCSITVRKL